MYQGRKRTWHHSGKRQTFAIICELFTFKLCYNPCSTTGFTGSIWGDVIVSSQIHVLKHSEHRLDRGSLAEQIPSNQRGIPHICTQLQRMADTWQIQSPPSTESDARPFVFFFRGPMSLDDHLHQDEWILNRIPAHGIYRFTSIEANFGHWCQVFDGRIHSQLFCGLPRVVCNWIRLVSGDSQCGITSANPRGTEAIPEEWSSFSADGCHGFHSIDT